MDVTVSSGRVTELNLFGNRLTGAIPVQLGQLTELLALDLGDNRLSGDIPVQLGQLTELEVLDLSENRLSGTIPMQLGQLTGLTFLDLSENDLSGDIPVQLGRLTGLDELWLSDNRLTGCIPLQLIDELFLSFSIAESVRPQQGGTTLADCAIIAEAGADRDVIPGEMVILRGSAGGQTPRGVTVLYAWAADTDVPDNAAADAMLSATDAPAPTFTVPADATAGQRFAFRLTVRDAEGSSGTSSATVTFTVNRSATGTPRVTGTAEKGQVLMADPSAIQDADGLTNARYDYQWLRFDSASDTTPEEIPGASGVSYTLTFDDTASYIAVRVHFTDDAGNAEALISAALGPVISLDVNRDSSVDAQDAAILHYAYDGSLAALVSDPRPVGVLLRAVLFFSLVEPERRGERFYRDMLRIAEGLRATPTVDINRDGAVDAQDAAVLYYAYDDSFARLLSAPGGRGNLLRTMLFSSLVEPDKRRDDRFYREMLRTARDLSGAEE